MDFYKIILFCIIALIVVNCADEPKTSSVQSDYERLLEEYQTIKESRNIANEDVVRQYRNINNIFERVSTISGKIINVRSDIEGVSLSEMDGINKHLDVIAKELEEARKQLSSGDNYELTRTIKSLQNIINEKQIEINILKQEKERLEQENLNLSENIEEKQEFIEKQQDTILQQALNLQNLQKNNWFEMGKELYNLYLEYEDISGGMFNAKNKQRMKENKKNILLRAKICFQESFTLGKFEAKKHINEIDRELFRVNN